MKRWFVALLLLFSWQLLLAQQAANQWINYSQPYLKFPVYQSAIYRVDFQTLNNALLSIGVSLADTNFSHNQIQLFMRGRQWPIYVNDGGDGKLNPGDFIEFYAKKNDGWLDSLLYDKPQSQNNPHYSLINDTIYGFLTISQNQNGLRFQSYTDFNYSNYNPAPYVLQEVTQSYTARYETGKTNSTGKTSPLYTAGEGWFDNVMTYLGSITKTVSTPNPYIGTGAPQTQIITTVATASDASNISGPDHRLGIKVNNTTMVDTSVNGYHLLKYMFNIPSSNINANTQIKFESLPLPTPPASDRMTPAFVQVIYPMIPNFGGSQTATFYIPANNNKTRLDIANFSSSNTSFIYDLTNLQRVSVTQSGNVVRAIFSPGNQKKCVISTENTIVNLTQLTKVSTNGLFDDYESLQRDSAFLIITHPNLITGALQYAAVKNANQLNALVVNVNQLYLQFGYGIPKHPLSIRHFSDFVLQTWPKKPHYLFLLGKSVTDYLCRNNPANYQNNLVPTFGFPSTDNLFTVGLNQTTNEPALATGRLMAINNADVFNYADKITQFENQKKLAYTVDNKAWMKQVLHFGGGSNIQEQNVLKNYLTNYETLISDTFYGAEVTSFYKFTTSVIQQTVSDSVKSLINKGISLLTFFGHAAGTALDISIENVNEYNNTGKYFLFLANSCNVGDIHTPAQSLPGVNQSFVLTPNKGAIAFLASTTLGYPNLLNTYTSEFYRQLSMKNYGAPIGKLMQQTVKTFQTTNVALIETCWEMGLHGDPSLVLNTHQKPEIVLSPNQIFFSPQVVTTDLDSFTINIVSQSIGKSISREISYEIKRQFPDGIDTILFGQTHTPIFKDTLSIKLPVLAQKSIGLNNFQVSFDYPIIQVDEFDNVSNNMATASLFITSDELIPIYPSDLSIISNKPQKFICSTSDFNAPQNQYLFEIDTTDKFNSPLKITTTQSSAGGLVEFTPQLPFYPDSVVYFWRVTPKNSTTPKWREHSFQYIPNHNGWGLSHFAQHKNNKFDFLQYQKNEKNLSFLPNQRQLTAQNIGSPNTQQEFNFIEYRVDGVLLEYGVCPPVSPSIYVAVFDSISLNPWGTRFNDGTTVFNPNNGFGNNNDLGGCRNRVEYFFTYVLNNPTQVNNFIQLVSQTVPNGNYILFYTVVNGQFNNTNIWMPTQISQLQSLGATQILQAGDSLPYMFFVKKGSPQNALQIVGTHPTDQISLSTQITNSFSFGNFKTPFAPPAQKWDKFNWQFVNNEPNQTDKLQLQLNGQTNNAETRLFYTDTILNSSKNLDTLNQKLLGYTGVFITANLTDETNKTPLIPKYLHLLNKPLPDLALAPNKHFYKNADSLTQGQDFYFSVGFQNNSHVTFPKHVIAYTLTNNVNQNSIVKTLIIDSLNPFEIYKDTLKLNTKNLTGNYEIGFEINPALPDSLFKPEKYLFNNRYETSIYVEADNINPLLEVTFDGIKILDGDIVSPKPEIVAVLKDNNPNLPLNDTNNFSIHIKYPDGLTKRIAFVNAAGQQNINFKQANAAKPEVMLVYNPNFTTDGTYELTVQATDASGNKSGNQPYKISFEVINKSTITEVMNYPNPFSTSTRFVFTLTGSQIPEVFTIQILTVTGKVIREITKNELGPIRIGRNITQYAWNGTDEFGDRLANGVYLYRVITKINSTEVEHRSSGADAFFTKGFGKMYLFR